MAGFGVTRVALRFARDRRGNVAILAGMAMLVMAGAGSIMADLGRAYMLQAELEATADAAALAAAARLPDRARAKAAAVDYARKNLPVEAYGQVLRAEDVIVGAWDPETKTIDPSKGANAVRVTVRMAAANGNAMPTMVAGVFGVGAMDLAHSATAGRRGVACVMALEPTADNALDLKKNVSLEAYDCTVQVNSSGADALVIKENATLTAAGICVAGAADITEGGTVTPLPTEGCPPQFDPLTDLAKPAIGPCRIFPKLEVPLVITIVTPGTFCGGMRIRNQAIVHFMPGTYVFVDGPMDIKKGGSIKGDGVTFFLTGSGSVINIEDGSEIELTAPKDGPLQGILVFQDPEFGGKHLWNSSKPAKLTGTIYLPNGDFISETTAHVTPARSCNILIARSIDFSKQSGMSIDLSSADCAKSIPAALSRTTALLE